MGKRHAYELGLLIAIAWASCTTKRTFTYTGSGSAGAPSDEGRCGDDELYDGKGCVTASVCPPGTYVFAAPTSSSDRACRDCPRGSFSSELNAAACVEWSKCGAGESESVPPSASSDRVCSTCGAGKYEAASGCKSLTICGDDQYESVAPSATSDRECEDVRSCAPGEKQTAAPTATTDRRCAPCPAATFSVEENATTCNPWTPCDDEHEQTEAGTATSDVVCDACSTAADRACSEDCPCESGEGVCTSDEQCVSGASCVAGSGKKVGRAGDTCLADHCDNDVQDEDETSVDCGGECRCRASFEIVPLKGIPDGLFWGDYKSMSRDGQQIAGFLNGDRISFPAVVAADGTVTQLPAYGKAGEVWSATADGSLLVGNIGCANPPNCTDTTWTIAKWNGASAPTVLSPGLNASVRAASTTGRVIAGDFYDSSDQLNHGFILNGNDWQTISELYNVRGVTPDGKYVVGTASTGAQAVLWEAQTEHVTKIGFESWESTTPNAINGTGPVVVGFGYMNPEKYIGFRWRAGALTLLGVLDGGDYTQPSAVSFDGSTIVGYTGNNSFQQAFIWTDDGLLRTVVDELVARGYEPPIDLKLTFADFISDDGKTIVGTEITDTPFFWRVVLE